MLDQATVQRLFTYDATTGILTWNTRARSEFPSDWSHKVWNKRFSGKPAGSPSGIGYLKVRILGATYLVHRVIWLLVHGEMPDAVDHINGDRADNRLVNLRAATTAENNRNAKRRDDNQSGHTGVAWDKWRDNWVAYISVEGVERKLGRFKSLADAVQVRKAAEQQFNFHSNHGRSA
jgi:hypothetical protein